MEYNSTRNNVKYSLLKADLASLEDEFEIDGLENGLRYQVQDLVQSEMNRNKTAIYKRVSISKVKKSSSFCRK